MNNGATFNANGKLGGCYYFNATSQFINLTNYMTTLKTFTNYSMSAWVYIETKAGDHSASILSSGNWNQATGQLVFGFYNWSTDHYTNLLVPNTSGWSNSIRYNFMQNTWYHITITYNGSKTLAYVNGTKIGEYNGGGIATTSETNNLYAGCATYYGAFNLRGRLNDVRIYDHALSPFEVKQISQGLILHYPLSDNSIQSLDNCYVYPRFETSNSSGGWSHWGGSGHAGTYGQTTDTNYIFRNGQTYAHWVANGSSATKNYLLYQSPAFDGGLRSLIAICKEENSKPITDNICYAAWNARNGGVVNNSWTSIQSLGNGFYLCKCEGISQSGSDDLVGISIKPGYKVYFSEIYLENYKSVCSDIFFPSMVVYDASGYGNNGISVGSFNVDKNTPKYNVSTIFDNNYIKNLSFAYTSNVWSISLWYYFETMPSAYQGFICLSKENGADTNKKMALMPNTNKIWFKVENKSGDIASLKIQQWTHIVLTCDGSDGKIYENGVLKKTVSGISSFYTDCDDLVIGARSAATNGTSISHYLDGKLSDVRIYCTALSAEDVLSLYNNSAYIDNQGNIYGAIYEEV